MKKNIYPSGDICTYIPCEMFDRHRADIYPSDISPGTYVRHISFLVFSQARGQVRFGGWGLGPKANALDLGGA